MAVFITVHVEGPHDRLTAAYDRIADYEEANISELGCHTCAKTDKGIFVSGVWSSRDSFDRLMASPEMQNLLRELALPEPKIEIYEVYRSRH